MLFSRLYSRSGFAWQTVVLVPHSTTSNDQDSAGKQSHEAIKQSEQSEHIVWTENFIKHCGQAHITVLFNPHVLLIKEMNLYGHCGAALLSASVQRRRPAIRQQQAPCEASWCPVLEWSEGHTPGVWLASLLCFQGNKTKKDVKSQQPPINVVDLVPGVVYHLRVYSHLFNSVSSKSVTFKTKAGETTPGRVERGASWAPLGISHK